MFFSAALLALSLSSVRLPQIEPRPAPAPAKPTEPAAKVERLAPTFENLHVDASELPPELKLETTPAFVSPKAATLLEEKPAGAPSTAAPTPKRRDFQTIASASGKGSVLYLEYAPADLAEAAKQAGTLIWGEGGTGPSRLRPELISRAGDVLVVISFPPGDPGATFVVERLRNRFGLRLAPAWDSGFRILLSRVEKANAAQDAAGGLKLLRGDAARVAASSMGAFYEGEFSLLAKDYAGAEKAYARALELDATSDPLPSEASYFQALDGRGMALWGLKRFDEAATVLRDATRIAAELRRTPDEARSLYNTACCLALLGKADEAMPLLARGFELDSKLRTHARTDTDLDSLRERPDFKKLTE